MVPSEFFSVFNGLCERPGVRAVIPLSKLSKDPVLNLEMNSHGFVFEDEPLFAKQAVGSLL